MEGRLYRQLWIMAVGIVGLTVALVKLLGWPNRSLVNRGMNLSLPSVSGSTISCRPPHEKEGCGRDARVPGTSA